MSKSSAPPALSPREGQIRLRQLQLLELIAGQGSLRAAAQSLHVSQPAVTMMLRELESAFGTPLVERNRRGANLTAAGHAALEHLRVASREFGAAITAAREAVRGTTIRLGALPLLSVRILPRAIDAMQRAGRLPRIVLAEGSVDELLARLREGDLDCVVAPVFAAANTAIDDLGGLVFDALCDESLQFVCSSEHPFARRRKVGAAELAGSRWVLPPDSTLTRRVFFSTFLRVEQAPPLPAIESSSFYTSLNIVSHSQLLTIAPTAAISLYRQLGAIATIKTPLAIETCRISFITRESNRQAESIETLKTFLSTAAASLR
ncbi:LysR substrate-binding domain-containing protein [Burkholderia guangdongensis]|uniref:LysR substrate-binding domain-containing protein n=1 Tax=Burkholderia guangdongensis TaxID=1792500 RepID=UPI0015CC2140|nr:LysR family transcriptional regulator [Burkholderia guangdongensis]